MILQARWKTLRLRLSNFMHPGKFDLNKLGILTVLTHSLKNICVMLDSDLDWVKLQFYYNIAHHFFATWHSYGVKYRCGLPEARVRVEQISSTQIFEYCIVFLCTTCHAIYYESIKFSVWENRKVFKNGLCIGHGIWSAIEGYTRRANGFQCV